MPQNSPHSSTLRTPLKPRVMHVRPQHRAVYHPNMERLPKGACHAAPARAHRHKPLHTPRRLCPRWGASSVMSRRCGAAQAPSSLIAPGEAFRSRPPA
jgi:hypothetical protein